MRGRLVLLCLFVLVSASARAQEKGSATEKLRAHPKLSVLDNLVKETLRPEGLKGSELYVLNQFLDPAKAKHLIPTDRFVELAEAARHKEDKTAVAKLILFATPVYDKEAKKWNHPPEKDIEQSLFQAEDGVYRSQFFGTKGSKSSPPVFSPAFLKLTNHVLSRTVPTKNGMVEPFPFTLSPDLLQPGKEGDLRKALDAAYDQLSRLDAGSNAHHSRMLALTVVVAMLERWNTSLSTLAWDLDTWRDELQYARKEWPKSDPKTEKKTDGPVHLMVPIFLHHSEEFKLLRNLAEQPKLRPHAEAIVKLIPASAKLHRPYAPVVEAVEAIAKNPGKAAFVKDVIRELAKAAPKLLDYLSFGYGGEPSFWNGGSLGMPPLDPKVKAAGTEQVRNALAALDLNNPADLSRARALGTLLGALVGWGPEPPQNAKAVDGWVKTLAAIQKLSTVAASPSETEKLGALKKAAHAVPKSGKVDFDAIQKLRREAEIALFEGVGRFVNGSGEAGDHGGGAEVFAAIHEGYLLTIIASMLDNPVETKNGVLEGFPIPLEPKLRHGGNEKQRDQAIDRIYLELGLLDIANEAHRHRQTALVALLAYLERWNLPMANLLNDIELWRQLGSAEAPKEKEQWGKQDPRFRTFLKFLPHQAQKAKLAQLDSLFPKNLKLSDDIRLEWVKAITKHPEKFDSVKSFLYNVAEADPFLLNYVGIDPDTAEPYFEQKAMIQGAVAKGAPFPLVKAKDNPVGNWVNSKLLKTALEDLFEPVVFKGKGPRYSFFDTTKSLSQKQFYALWDPFFKEQTGHTLEEHLKDTKGYPPNSVYRVLFRTKLENDLPPPDAHPSCGALGPGASDALKTAHQECLLYAADLTVRLKEGKDYATRLAEAKHLYGPVVRDINIEITRLTKSGANPPVLAQLWRTRSTLARLLEPNFSRTADKGKLFENSLWLEFDEYVSKKDHFPGLKMLILPTQMSDPKFAEALVMNALSKLNPTQVGLQLFVYYNGKNVTPGPLGEKAAYKKAHEKYAYHADPHVRPLTFRTSPLVPPAEDFAYVIMETARNKGKVALYAGYNQPYWDLWTTIYNPASGRAKLTINIFDEVDRKNGTYGWKTEVNAILNEFQKETQDIFKLQQTNEKAAQAKVTAAIHKLEEVIGPLKGPNSRLPEILEVVRLLPKNNLFKWMVFEAAVPDHIIVSTKALEILEKMPNDLLAQLHLMDTDIPTEPAAQLAFLEDLLNQHRASQGPAEAAPKTDGPDGPPQDAPKIAKSSLPHPFLRCAETKMNIPAKNLALTKEEMGAFKELPRLYREVLDIVILSGIPGVDPEKDCAEYYKEDDVREIVAVLRLPTPGNILSFLSRNDSAMAVLGPRLQQIAGKGWPAGKASLQSLITGFSKASAKEKESLRHWAYQQLKEKLAAEDPATGTEAYLKKLSPEAIEKLAAEKGKGWLSFKEKQASEIYLLSLLIGLIDEDGGDGALAQKEHVENEFRKGGLFRFEPHFLVWAMGREYEAVAKHFDPPKAKDASPYEGTPKTEQGHLFAFAQKELHSQKKGLSSFPRTAYFTGDPGSFAKAKTWLGAWKSAIDGKSPIHQSDTSKQLLGKALQWPEPMRIVQLISTVDPQLAATIIQSEGGALKGMLADQLKKTGKLDEKGQAHLKMLATGLYGLKPGTPPDEVRKKETQAEKEIREQLAVQLVDDYREKLIAAYAKKEGEKADLAKIRKQVNVELSDLQNVLFWDEAYLKTQSPNEQKIWGDTINRHGAFLAELRQVLGIPSYTEWQNSEKAAPALKTIASAKSSFFSSQGIADALRFLGMETLADHLHKEGPVVAGAPVLTPFDSVQAKNFRAEAEKTFSRVLDDAENNILEDLAPKACAYWNDSQEKITADRNAKLEPTLKGIQKAEANLLKVQFRHGGKAQKTEQNYVALVSRVPQFEEGVRELKLEYDVKNPDNLPLLKKQVAERQAKAKEVRKAADQAHVKWKDGGKTDEDWNAYLSLKSDAEQAEKSAADYAAWHTKLSGDRDAFKADLPALKKELEAAEKGLVHLKKMAGEAYREYQQAKTLEAEYLTEALNKLETAKAAHATALKSVMDKSMNIPKDVYKYKYVPKVDAALDEAVKNSKGQFGLFAKTLIAQSLPDEDLKRFSKVETYAVKLADYCQFLEQLGQLAKVLVPHGDYKSHPLYQDLQKRAASGTGLPWAVGKAQFDELVSDRIEKSKTGVTALNKALARIAKTGLDPFSLDIEKITNGADVWGALDEFSKAIPKSGLSPILGVSYDPKHIVQQKVLEKWLLLKSPQRFALNKDVGVIVHALESGPEIEFRPLAEMQGFAQKHVATLEKNLEAYQDGLPAWLQGYNTYAAFWMLTRPDLIDTKLHKLRNDILSDIAYLKNAGDIEVKVTINAKGKTDAEKYRMMKATDAALLLEMRLDSLLRATDTTLAQIAEDIDSQIRQAYVELGVTVATLGFGKGLTTVGGKLFTAGGKATNIFAKGGLYLLGAGIKGIPVGLNYAKLHQLQQLYRSTVNPLIFGGSATPYRFSQDEANLYWGMLEFWVSGGAGAWLQNLHYFQALGRWGGYTANFASFSSVGFARAKFIDGSSWPQSIFQGISKGILMSPFDDAAAGLFNNPFLAGLSYQAANGAADVVVAISGVQFRKSAHQEELDRLNALPEEIQKLDRVKGLIDYHKGEITKLNDMGYVASQILQEVVEGQILAGSVGLPNALKGAAIGRFHRALADVAAGKRTFDDVVKELGGPRWYHHLLPQGLRPGVNESVVAEALAEVGPKTLKDLVAKANDAATQAAVKAEIDAALDAVARQVNVDPQRLRTLVANEPATWLVQKNVNPWTAVQYVENLVTNRLEELKVILASPTVTPQAQKDAYEEMATMNTVTGYVDVPPGFAVPATGVARDSVQQAVFDQAVRHNQLHPQYFDHFLGAYRPQAGESWDDVIHAYTMSQTPTGLQSMVAGGRLPNTFSYPGIP